MTKKRKQKQKKTAKSAVRSKPKSVAEPEPLPVTPLSVRMLPPPPPAELKKAKLNQAPVPAQQLDLKTDLYLEQNLNPEPARHQHSSPNKRGYTLVDGVWVKDENIMADTIKAAAATGLNIDSSFDSGLNSLMGLLGKVMEKTENHQDAILTTLRDINETLKDIAHNLDIQATYVDDDEIPAGGDKEQVG